MKNLRVVNALVANVVDEVSDHNLIKVEIGAPSLSRKRVTFADQRPLPTQVNPREFP